MGNNNTKNILSNTESQNLNFCNSSDFISHISGLEKNSNSPSDTWIVYFNENIQSIFPNISIITGFCKIFLSDSESNINLITSNENIYHKLSTINYIYALNYERKIYENLISFFLQKRFSPNFLRPYSYSTNCTYENLLNLVNKNIQSLTYEEIKNNLDINVASIIHKLPTRTKIDNNDNKTIFEDIMEEEHILKLKPYHSLFTFNVLMLETINSTVTKSLKEFIEGILSATDEEFNEKDLSKIYFQIYVNLYLFSLVEMVHNDLHLDNIFIEKLESEKLFIYVIKDKPYFLRTKYKVIIYDFDYSYCPILQNNQILDENYGNCKKFFRCNKYSKIDTIWVTTFILKSFVSVKEKVSKLKNIVFNDTYEDDYLNGNVVSNKRKMKHLMEITNDLLFIIDEIYKIFFSYSNLNLKINSRDILEQYTYFIDEKYINKIEDNYLFDEEVFEQSKTKGFNKILLIVEILKKINEYEILLSENEEKFEDFKHLKNELNEKQKELHSIDNSYNLETLHNKKRKREDIFVTNSVLSNKIEEIQNKKQKNKDGKKSTKKKKKSTKKMKKSIKKKKNNDK
jgi:hypothetical protein